MIAARQKARAPSSKYGNLVRQFPLRPLHDESDYDHALKVAESLVGLAEMTEDQADYLDVLVDIIQKYESRRHAIGGTATPQATLARLLEEQGLSASDLGRLLGNRALGSAILRGERQLSKTHIRVLAETFKVSADLFL